MPLIDLSRQGKNFFIPAGSAFYLGSLTDVEEAALLITLVGVGGGAIWFNSTNSQYMGWNGTTAVILG